MVLTGGEKREAVGGDGTREARDVGLYPSVQPTTRIRPDEAPA